MHFLKFPILLFSAIKGRCQEASVENTVTCCTSTFLALLCLAVKIDVNGIERQT